MDAMLLLFVFDVRPFRLCLHCGEVSEKTAYVQGDTSVGPVGAAETPLGARLSGHAEKNLSGWF